MTTSISVLNLIIKKNSYKLLKQGVLLNISSNLKTTTTTTTKNEKFNNDILTKKKDF